MSSLNEPRSGERIFRRYAARFERPEQNPRPSAVARVLRRYAAKPLARDDSLNYIVALENTMYARKWRCMHASPVLAYIGNDVLFSY